MATRARATSVPGGRVEVAPNAYRKPSPIAQPSSSEQTMAAARDRAGQEARHRGRCEHGDREGRDPLAAHDVGDGEQRHGRHDDDVEGGGAALAVGLGQRGLEEVQRPGEDRPHQADDDDGAEDRRAQRLDELHRPTPHDQVGADDEREQDDTDRAQPGQQGEQESWQPADGVGEVLLDRATGADRGDSERDAADEHDQGERRAGTGRPGGGPGRGWVARRPRP